MHDRWLDTTWPSATRTAAAGADWVVQPCIPETNLLLRWIGVRSVFHLPCSADCQPSIVVGRRLRGALGGLGYEDEAGWLEELLTMPVTWSGHAGTARIQTPILRLAVASDPLPRRRVVTRPGREDEHAGGPADGS